MKHFHAAPQVNGLHRTLADLDMLRSGMALAYISPDYTLGDCVEGSWAALEGLLEFNPDWEPYLVRVEGELYHPPSMEGQGQGFHAWLEYREPSYPDLVVDPMVALFLLRGHDPSGMRWLG